MCLSEEYQIPMDTGIKSKIIVDKRVREMQIGCLQDADDRETQLK